MTDERARKQGIRRRMEATGEKYTEARRAIVGSDGPAVSGDQWLAEVFSPALGDEQIRSSNVVERWRGAVGALEACGLLTPEQATDARRRLKEATRAATRRTAPALARPGSVALPPRDALRHAFPPLTPLVDFEGVTLVVVSIELWTRSVRLRIAGLHNATSDQMDKEHRRALERWAQKLEEARARDLSSDDPPRDAGARMLDMRLVFADDLGTHYRSAGRFAGGTGTEWRLDARFEPAMPRAARQLTIAVNDLDGNFVNDVKLAVPPPG